MDWTKVPGAEEAGTASSTADAAVARPAAPERVTAPEVFGAIVGLMLLGIAQPIFELFARRATFFVARGSPAVDVVVFAVGVALLVPALLALMVVLAARLHPPTGRVLFLLSTGLLGALLVLRVLKLTVPAGSAWLLVPALGLGGVIARAIERSEQLRSLLKWAPLLAVAVVVWFLLLSPVSQVVRPAPVSVAPLGTVRQPVDVVMVILDELPLATLLDRDMEIDQRLFPGFARLARSANWYRNATTVNDNTVRAVPALLDGRYPELDLLPTAADHPKNIFTLLGSDYRVQAEEIVTRMCPKTVCPEDIPGFSARARSLFGDGTLVAAHMLLPADLTRELTPVDEQWGDFAVQATARDLAGVPKPRALIGQGDPAGDLRAFIERIEPTPDPDLFFSHVLLPHSPWRYLPEGYEYDQDQPIPGTIPIVGEAGTQWSQDDWLAAQAYQRHILQTMLVDRMIDLLLDRLHQQEMFEEALIVIASDHGTAFVPGQPRRSPAPETTGSIAPVALFIKEPGQTEGKTIDAPVQTIDVLPTIAELVDAEESWAELDGKPLNASSSGTPGRKLANTPYSDDGFELRSVVARKYELFGGAPLDPFALLPPGAPDLLGRPGPKNPPQTGATVAITRRLDYFQVDLGSHFLPALLRAQLEEPPGSGDPPIAVALNGRIVALTRASEDEDGGFFFQALLPAEAFQAGFNVVRLFVVEGRDGGFRLSRLMPE